MKHGVMEQFIIPADTMPSHILYVCLSVLANFAEVWIILGNGRPAFLINLE